MNSSDNHLHTEFDVDDDLSDTYEESSSKMASLGSARSHEIKEKLKVNSKATPKEWVQQQSNEEDEEHLSELSESTDSQ
ncbi:MAG: hypothetical protein ACRCXC_02520 [Legionella sp.]